MSEADKPLLQIEAVIVRFGGVVAVDGASFSGNVSMGPQAAKSAPATQSAAAPPEPEPAPEGQVASSSDGKQKPPPGKGKPRR